MMDMHRRQCKWKLIKCCFLFPPVPLWWMPTGVNTKYLPLGVCVSWRQQGVAHVHSSLDGACTFFFVIMIKGRSDSEVTATSLELLLHRHNSDGLWSPLCARCKGGTCKRWFLFLVILQLSRCFESAAGLRCLLTECLLRRHGAV